MFPADIDRFSESLPLQVLESATKKQKVDGPDVSGPKFHQRLKIGVSREEEIWAIKFEGFPHVSPQFSDQSMCRHVWKESGKGAVVFFLISGWCSEAGFGMVLSNVKQSRAIPTFFFKHKHHKPDLKHSLSIDKGERNRHRWPKASKSYLEHVKKMKEFCLVPDFLFTERLREIK